MSSSSDDELVLVHELPMDMDTGDGSEERRLAHLLPPLTRTPGPPPFRPRPPPAAVASAESRVNFRSWLGAPRHWDLWVAKLRPIHERLWRKLGILDAVIASTYRFKRDAPAVLHLASFWCPHTSSFAFPWGEATITLQDVAVLGGLPTRGLPAPAPLPPEWLPDEAALNGVRLGFNRSACKKAHHSAWIKHFLTDTTTDAYMEHAAFLALWLTRFVLPGHPESTMRQSLFPLAVRLARGERVALAPAVLASLYRDLREIKAYLVAAGAVATGSNAELMSVLSVYSPLYIVQLWMWERFPVLWDGKAKRVKNGETRAARWHDVSKKMNPTVVRKALCSGKNFVWEPYTSSVHSGWVRGCDVAANEELRSLAQCLHACELVGMDCVEQYLPHRVARQFGLDQDVPGDIRRANTDLGMAWQTYDLEGENVAFYIPQSEPGITARYAQWWRQPLPHTDLDFGATSIAMKGKCSKRKVKKTPAAIEAEEEKERKMKKARITPNNDKKRKLEELYDAKLSNWLASARIGSSGTSGGSCKRESSPQSDAGSDTDLLDNLENRNDDIVLLVPRKHVLTPAVNLKDKDINPATEDKGVNLKGYMISDIYHPMNLPYFKEKESMISTETPTFTEDDNGEWSDKILEDTNQLVRGETPGVPNRPDEVNPPVKKECSDQSSDAGCSEDAREEVVAAVLPDISSEPGGGATAMLEDKSLNIQEDKSPDVTYRAHEDTTVMLELEKEANLAVNKSFGVSNGPEEVTAPIMEEKVDNEPVEVVDEGNAASEGAGRTAVGISCSIEVKLGRKQGADAGVINNPNDAVALPQELPSVQQTNHVGECVEMSYMMEDSSVVAEFLETNDEETTCVSVIEDQREVSCVEEIGGESNQTVEKDRKQKPQEASLVDIVECVEMPCILEDSSLADGILRTNDEENACDFAAKDQREVSCVEETGGGENNQMVEKNNKQKPQEAPQADIEECGEGITPMEKGNEGDEKIVPETEALAVIDNNMGAVLLGVREEEHADIDTTPKLGMNTEDMPKKVVGVDGAEQEQINTSAKGGPEEEFKVVAEVESIGMAEYAKVESIGIAGPKMHAQFDTEKAEEIAEVAHAEMDDNKRLTGRDADGKHGVVPEVGHSEVAQAKELIDNDTDEKLAEVSDVAHAEMEDVKSLMKEDANKKFEELSEIENTGTEETHESIDVDTDSKLKEVPAVNAEVEQAKVLERDNDRLDCILQVNLPSRDEAKSFAKGDTADNTTDFSQVKHEKLSDETPTADVKDLLEKDLNVSIEVYHVEQEKGEGYKVLREKDSEENTKDALGVKQANEGQVKAQEVKYVYDCTEKIALAQQLDGENERLVRIGVEENPEDITQAQEKECDKDIMRSLKNSINSDMLCSSASIQPRGEKEVSGEGVMDKQGIQDFELIDERGSSFDGPATKVEGVDDHMHKDLAIEQIQDCGIICMTNEAPILENNHMINSGLKADLVIMEVDENQSKAGIQNHKTMDLVKQQEMEERQDIGTATESKEVVLSEDANIVCCVTCHTDMPEAELNEEQAADIRVGCELTDGNVRPLEVTNTLGGGKVDTIAVGVDVNNANSVEVIQNHKASSSEELQARVDKQHHRMGNANEERSLEDAGTIDIGELKSDATVVGISGSESTEATRNQVPSSMEMEQLVPEKQDEAVVQENTKRISANQDAPECEVNLHGAMKMTRDILPTIQSVNILGDKSTSEDQQKGLLFGAQNISEKEPTMQEKQDEGMADENAETNLVNVVAPESECGGVKPDGTMKMDHEIVPTVQSVNSAVENSEPNQTARMESKGTLPTELQHRVEVKEENLENNSDMPIGRENDEASEQDQTSVEDATVSSSILDHQGESNNEWPEGSIKGYGKYASDPVNTGSQTSKFGRPSIEEVRRLHDSRSVNLKDIKESQGKIRSEPPNRIQTNNVGHYSRHEAQEPVSVGKDIKVPFHDTGAKVYGRDRAHELVTGPPEDTSQWMQEQCALEMLESVQNARAAEKTRMEMEIKILKAQIASMQRQVMNLDRVGEVVSRSKRCS